MVEDATSAAQGRCGDGFRLYAEIYALRLVGLEHDVVAALRPAEPLVEPVPIAVPEVPR